VVVFAPKVRRASRSRVMPRGTRHFRNRQSSQTPLPLAGHRVGHDFRPVPGVSEWVCRIISIGVAAVGIVLTLPLMVLIALVVKSTSRGPVFYTQPRVGIDLRISADRRIVSGRDTAGRRRSDHGGRIFTIYKFRTMRVVQDLQDQVWATSHDPRITGVGRILRKFRLDELPQLFNVLKGDMNVVGPRPEQPEIFGRLRGAVRSYADRQRVLPGITGWAQVNHAYDQCLEDVELKVALDLEYIAKRSPVKDLKIMARTVPVMVGRKGAV